MPLEEGEAPGATPGSTKRVKIRDVNAHLACVLCSGYLVDATTIIECMHSFCRTCIVRYLETSKYCPICDVLVHKTKPLLHVRPDKMLQALVYKIVPGLFHSEVRKRREFWAKTREPALGSGGVGGVLTPEEEAEEEEEEREEVAAGAGGGSFFSAEDSISLSLEYYDSERAAAEEDDDDEDEEDDDLAEVDEARVDGEARRRIGRRGFLRLGMPGSSSDNENNDLGKVTRRYLKCPAAVTMLHLKKFIRMKYGLSDDNRVDVIYKDECLPDEFSLMDVAYTFSWRRKRPMRFSYRIFKKPKPPVRRRILRSITTNGPRSIMSLEGGTGDGSSEGDSVMKTPPPEDPRNEEGTKLEEGRMEEEGEAMKNEEKEEEERKLKKEDKEATKNERVEEEELIKVEFKEKEVKGGGDLRKVRRERMEEERKMLVEGRARRERAEVARERSRMVESYAEDDDEDDDEEVVRMPVSRRGRKSRREDRRGKSKGRPRGEDRGRKRKAKRAKSKEKQAERSEERPRKRQRVEVVAKAVEKVVEKVEEVKKIKKVEEEEKTAAVNSVNLKQKGKAEPKEPEPEKKEEIKEVEDIPLKPEVTHEPVAEDNPAPEVEEEVAEEEVHVDHGAESVTNTKAARSPGSTIKSKDESTSSPESSFRLVLEDEDEEMELLILEDSMEDRSEGTGKEEDDIEEEVEENNEEEKVDEDKVKEEEKAPEVEKVAEEEKVVEEEEKMVEEEKVDEEEKEEEECRNVEEIRKDEETSKPFSPPAQPTPPPTPEKTEEPKEEEEGQSAKEGETIAEVVKDLPAPNRKPLTVTINSGSVKTTQTPVKQSSSLVTKVPPAQKPQQSNKNASLLNQNSKSPPPQIAKSNPVQVKLNNASVTKTALSPQLVINAQTVTAQPKQAASPPTKTVPVVNKTSVSTVSKPIAPTNNKLSQPPSKPVANNKVTTAASNKNSPTVHKSVASAMKPTVAPLSKPTNHTVPKAVPSQPQLPTKSSNVTTNAATKSQPNANLKINTTASPTVKASLPSNVSKPIPALTAAPKPNTQTSVGRPSSTTPGAPKVVTTTAVTKAGATIVKSNVTMVKIASSPASAVKTAPSATSNNKSPNLQVNRVPGTTKASQGQGNSQKSMNTNTLNASERSTPAPQGAAGKSAVSVTSVKTLAPGGAQIQASKVVTSPPTVAKATPSPLPKPLPAAANTLPKATTVTPTVQKPANAGNQGSQQPRSTPPMPGLAAIKRKLPEGTTVRRSSRDSSADKKEESQDLQPPPMKKKKKTSKGDKVTRGSFTTFPVAFKRVNNLQPPTMLPKPRVGKAVSPTGDESSIIHDDYGALDLSGRSSRKSESPPAPTPSSSSPTSAPPTVSSASPSHKSTTPTPPPPPPSPSKSPKAPQSQHSILSIAQTLVNRQLSSSRGAGGKSPARETPTPPLPPKTPPRSGPAAKPSSTPPQHQSSSSPSPASPRQQQQTPPAGAMSNLMTLTDTAVKILMAERTAATASRLPSPTPATQQSSSAVNPPPAHPRPSGAPIRSTNPSLMSPLRIPVPPVSHHQYHQQHQHQPAPPRNQRPPPPHSATPSAQPAAQLMENGEGIPHLPRGLSGGPVQNGRGGFRSRGANPLLRLHGIYSGGKPGPNQGVRQIPNPSLLTQPQNRMHGMGRGQGDHMHHPQLSIQPTSLHHQFQHQLQQQRRGGGYGGGGPKPPYPPPGPGRGPPNPHGPPGMPPPIRNIEHLTRSIEKVAAGLTVRAVDSRAK